MQNFLGDGELNPDLKTGGSVKCLRTISAPCKNKTGRKPPVQMSSGRQREEAALFDLSNKQDSMQLRIGWGGGSRSQHQARLMAASGLCCSHGSLLKDPK